ncbi:50S ribosomal protein L13 [Candidatus Woesearchaeota archaeon]|nr:50S ribosomal protein L13 [Candidatus Woesearchaeota archaeon]
MIIDATNLILGRLASYAAKNALQGEDIKIVNCEKAVISGNKKYLLEKYKLKFDKGVPLKGPYFPRMPDRIVRRTVRGMLPYKKPRGREAYKKIMCYTGVPEELSKEKPITIKEADASKLPTTRFLTVEKISKHLGAKI